MCVRRINLWILMLTIGMTAHAVADQPSQNMLWDGGFESGYGNGYWANGAAARHSRQSDWREGGFEGNRCVHVDGVVGSRVYELGEGPSKWTMSLYAKLPDDAAASSERLVVNLTNANYYRWKKNNRYHRKFTLKKGEDWQHLTFSFEIESPYRPYFHVELTARGVLVDAVSLTPGEVAPRAFTPHQPIVTGFRLPDDTHIFSGDEPREVYFVVHNYDNSPRETSAVYEVLDFREQVIATRTLALALEPRETKEIFIDVNDLPNGGYRLTSRCDSGDETGDSLFAVLPRVDHTASPRFGANVTLGGDIDFAVRYMNKLSIGFVSTVSTGEMLGNWSAVQPQPERFIWQDTIVDALVNADIWPIVYLNPVGRSQPKWVGYNRDDEVSRQKTIDAFGRYVHAFVSHYAGRVRHIALDDEVERKPEFKESAYRPYVADLYREAYKQAHRAAREKKAPLHVTTNTMGWAKLLDLVPPDYFDFYSWNTIHQPSYTRRVLETLQSRNINPDFTIIPAVGQQGPTRATSMIVNRPPKIGELPGNKASQVIPTLWQSRPFAYRADADGFGPLIHYGFYEIRFAGQTVFRPVAGWTGMTFDNSPDLGFQGVVTMRHLMHDLKPDRDPSQLADIRGLPVGESGRVRAYPFRDDKRAVVALLAHPLNVAYQIRPLGPRGRFFDLYANPIEAKRDGSVQASEFPIYFECDAARLSAVKSRLDKWRLAEQQAPARRELRIGDLVLTINTGQDGRIALDRIRNGAREPIFDNCSLVPENNKTFTCTSNGITATARQNGKGLSFSLQKNQLGIMAQSNAGRLLITLSEASAANRRFIWLVRGKGYESVLPNDFGLRIPSGRSVEKQTVKPAVLDIDGLVRITVELSRHELDEKNVSFKTESGKATLALQLKPGQQARLEILPR